MIHENILSAVGGTPLVAINRLNPNPNVKILAKVEFFNPGGSIKDRVALSMIEKAEREGELTPEKTIIEATSGNTGIGLAMVCAVKGYKLTLLMPDSASEERKAIMRAYGADILLTPGRLATDGAIEEAYRLAREAPDKYVLMDQYNNPASIEAHYRGTGREIWDQTEGRVTHVVATLGTSGTAMGVTKIIRELSKTAQVVAVEPYPGHGIQGLKNMQASYPPGIYDKNAPDRIVRVEDEEAFEMTRRLAREEGIFAGMSSGAAVASAVKLAAGLESGLIVAILPDGGERYLSTPLFRSSAKQGVSFEDAAKGERVYISPAPGEKAGLFTMGPSLDRFDDVDAWRRIVLLDVLAAYMNQRGDSAELLVGLADMDDRALAAARNHNQPLARYVEEGVGRLQSMARAFGIGQSVRFIPAGRSVDRVLGVCRKLLARGAAYEKLRSVYFDVVRYERYGRMSGMDLDKIFHGKTVDLADYAKDNPKDFTLLKRASLQDLKAGDCLQTEWGNVRPSWFLQLAAAAMDGLKNLSLFMLDQTQRFPHMENFRAIWSLGGGIEPKAWLVCSSVTGIPPHEEGPLDLLSRDGLGPLRMWLLSTSHRKPLHYSEQSLGMWRKNWERVQNLAAALTMALPARPSPGSVSSKQDIVSPEVDQSLVQLKTGFREAMEQDLSLHRYWPVLFKFCRETNEALSSGRLTPAEAARCLKGLTRADQVLNVLDKSLLPLPASKWPQETADLVREREKARTAKNFSRADELRTMISDQGYRLEDSPRGAILYPK